MTLIIHLLVFIVAIIVTWLCAGFVVDFVWKIAKLSKKNSFFVAFFLLGFLTSLSEFSVGLNSLLNKTPEVAAGNLTGGPFVLLLFLIPLLAIIGNGMKFINSFKAWHVASIFGVIALPSVFFLKGTISYLDGLIMIGAYVLLVAMLRNHSDSKETGNEKRRKV